MARVVEPEARVRADAARPRQNFDELGVAARDDGVALGQRAGDAVGRGQHRQILAEGRERRLGVAAPERQCPERRVPRRRRPPVGREERRRGRRGRVGVPGRRPAVAFGEAEPRDVRRELRRYPDAVESGQQRLREVVGARGYVRGGPRRQEGQVPRLGRQVGREGRRVAGEERRDRAVFFSLRRPKRGAHRGGREAHGLEVGARRRQRRERTEAAAVERQQTTAVERGPVVSQVPARVAEQRYTALPVPRRVAAGERLAEAPRRQDADDAAALGGRGRRGRERREHAVGRGDDGDAAVRERGDDRVALGSVRGRARAVAEGARGRRHDDGVGRRDDLPGGRPEATAVPIADVGERRGA